MRYLPALALLSALTISAADVQVIEEIVCKVNGDIITRTDLERDRRDAENEFRHEGMTGRNLQDAISQAMRNELRSRIDQLLLVQKGKELDLKVDGEVAKEIANIQRKSGIADPEKFQEYVKEQRGEPFEDYKSEIKNHILTQHVIRQEVSSTIKIPRQDEEQYYNDHKKDFQRQERVFLSKIYISTEGKDVAAAAAAERKAKDLVARARKGEKFSDLVQNNSDDPGAANGGEMPPFEKGQLAKNIEDALWDQPRGYVSDPFKLNDPPGFYIFKIEDHQKAGLAEFEEVQFDIESKLFDPKMQPALRAYLTKLRSEAYLQIKPGYEDSGAAPGKNTAWEDPAQLKPETVTKEEVAAKTKKKKILWLIPVPGTQTTQTGSSVSH